MKGGIPVCGKRLVINVYEAPGLIRQVAALSHRYKKCQEEEALKFLYPYCEARTYSMVLTIKTQELY